MNDTAIKNYAVWARRELMAEVSKRCTWWGILEKGSPEPDAESVDGHDVRALRGAFERAKGNAGTGKPSVVLAHTVKGKGVSFMENNILWHYRTPQGEEYEAALKELEAQRP